jgi:O-antigen/teichoic acid export membrane protein
VRGSPGEAHPPHPVHPEGLPLKYRGLKDALGWGGSLGTLPSLQATFLVFGGKVASGGAGFLSTILLVRALGQRDFGLFSFGTTVMLLGWWLSGGTVELGLVKSFSAHAEKERGKADAVLRLTLMIKLAVGLSLVGIGWILAEPVAIGIFHKPEFVLPLRYGVIGALGLSLWGYVLATLQSLQAFGKYALGESLYSLMRLGLIGFFLAISQLGTTTALWIYILASLFCFAVGMGFIPSTSPPSRTEYREAGRELLIIGKWVMVSWICASLHTRLDMLMLGYLGAVEALGTYAAALSLLAPLDLLASALSTVLLPKVSRFRHRAEHLVVLRNVLMGGTGLALLLIPVFSLAEPLIIMVYTIKFAEAVSTFRLLLFGSVFWLIGLSASAVLLALSKPQILAAFDGLVLVVVSVGTYVLIPAYGPTGAAIVVLGSRAISGLGLYVCAFREAGRRTDVPR